MKERVVVRSLGAHLWQVEVQDSQKSWSYWVSVPEDLLGRLGLSSADEEALVEETFWFLLRKEPPSSILRRFSLEVTGSYFPDYEAEMRSIFHQPKGARGPGASSA
jgi:hypothetical protein